MLIHHNALSLCAAAATTALGLLAAGPARAQSDQSELFVITAPWSADILMQRVSYRDLDLTYAPARVTLIRRVDFAVKKVCQESDQRAVRTLEAYTHYVSCRNLSWNRARPQVASAINRAWARAGWRASG